MPKCEWCWGSEDVRAKTDTAGRKALLCVGCRQWIRDCLTGQESLDPRYGPEADKRRRPVRAQEGTVAATEGRG